MTTYFETNDVKMNTSDVEKKIKILREEIQNFKVKASNMQLDNEDTQLSNWNGKYLFLTLELSYLLFYLFLSCSMLVKYDLMLRYEARLNALVFFLRQRTFYFDRWREAQSRTALLSVRQTYHYIWWKNHSMFH